MIYYQGNLAVDEKHVERAMPKQKSQQPVAQRQPAPAPVKPQPGISVGVKLTRLAAVVLVVCVLVFLMGRYTQIYEYNLEIRNVQKESNELLADNSSLRQQAEMLRSPDRLKAKAQEWGFVPPNQDQAQGSPSSDKTANASKQADAAKSSQGR